jgi:hypothetical protein
VLTDRGDDAREYALGDLLPEAIAGEDLGVG